MNEHADDEAAEAVEPAPSSREQRSGARELALKGGIVLALLIAAIAVFVAFQAISEAISTWLQDRWVPVWRAVFAVGVAAVALDVVRRLTGVEWSS